MKALVTIDANNIIKKNDAYWCDTLHEYSFWNRYLNVFEEVIGVTRVRECVPELEQKAINRVDGPNVIIKELPFAQGMKGYVLGYKGIREAAYAAVEEADVAIIRLPSVIGFSVMEAAKKKKIPIAIEVVADPWEAYKPNWIARILYTAKLNSSVKQANGVAYVTREYLQKKYPCKAIRGDNGKYFTTNYSSIDLPDEYFGAPKVYGHKEQWTLIHTSNGIHNDLKGHETVIRAAKLLKEKGINVKVIFVGDGRKKEDFEKLAEELEISNCVNFVGLISNKTVLRNMLISSDIFVFPTHTEGLPRSLIEAMATGLPAISTPVGGIPELLSRDNLLDPMDYPKWADKIEEYINNPELMTRKSKENIETAREYRAELLTMRRNDYYIKLRKLAEKAD